MSRNAELAVLTRSAQWALDEAAFAIGDGRYGLVERQRLAAQLTELVEELLADDQAVLVIESSTSE